MALSTDWAVARMTEAFLPVERHVLVSGQDAEAVFENLGRRFGSNGIGVQLEQISAETGLLSLVETGGMTPIERAATETSQ